MSGRIVQISSVRVPATGSIRASDRVWLLTDAEAARMRVPART